MYNCIKMFNSFFFKATPEIIKQNPGTNVPFPRIIRSIRTSKNLENSMINLKKTLQNPNQLY